MTKVSNQAQILCLRDGHEYIFPSPEHSHGYLLPGIEQCIGWKQSAKRVQEFGFGSETGSLFSW